MNNVINYSHYSQEDIKRDILRACTSLTFQKINTYYREDNIFSIIGKSRSENVHSNFLQWLFNRGSNHGLGVYPTQMLLRVIDYVKTKSINEVAYIPEHFEVFIENINNISDVKLYRERVIHNNDNKTNLRIDLLFEIDFIEELHLPQLRIVIENKVNSSENKGQTTVYYKATQSLNDFNVEYVYLYLTPAPNKLIESLNRQQCVSNKFIQINYQLLLEYIIQPCKSRCTSKKCQFYLDNYIRCLGDTGFFEEDNKRGVIVMAVSNEENKLLRTFWDENEKLIKATINSVLNDEEHCFNDDEMRTMYKALQIDVKSIKRKFTFKGEKLALNNIVLEFIKLYVIDNPNLSYEDLCIKFPRKIQGPFGVIKKLEDLTESDKGSNRANNQPYFFLNDPIKLKNGTEIVVCNQWGAGGYGTNFLDFIDVVKKLNYHDLIKEIQ